MFDLPVQPAMATIFAQRAAPAKIPTVAPVQDSSTSGQSALQHNGTGSQNPPTELQRHMAENRQNDRLVGPPPSFQANVLEVETDIKHAIERLDEKREKARNRDATTPINNPNKADKSEYLPETRKPDLKAEPPNENPEKKVEIDRLA